MDSGNLLTLWNEALPPESIPSWPGPKLAEAKGGETNYYIASEVKVSDSRSRIIVGERAAEVGEALRDPTMRFIPDWSENLSYRLETEQLVGDDPEMQSLERSLCKSSILYFVNTYCWTYDPRRKDNRKIPFATYPFQDDVLTWMVWLLSYGRGGLGEKSRDMGFSWMAVAMGVWLSVCFELTESLFMSMREEDVDNRKMGSLLGKVRFLVSNLPEWLRAGWVEHGQMDNSMSVGFPETKSSIQGILSRGTAGRSGRSTICFADEFAFVEESESVLAALTELSNSKVFLSTPNGMGNAFARMAEDPGTIKKTLHWYLHPLKNDDWAKWRRSEPDMTEELWAQEHGIQYETSTIGGVFTEFQTFPLEDVPWVHVQEGSFVEYDPAFDVYSTTDLGISDPCSTLFMQIKPAPDELKVFGNICYVFFAEHEARNMTAYDLRYYINQQPYRYREHIVDVRTGNAKESSGKSWKENLADDRIQPAYSKFFRRVIDPGKPVYVTGKRSYEDPTLEKMRTLLNIPGGVVFSKFGCPHAVRAMQNWSFPIDTETRKPRPGSSPEHSEWSHACKAILYLIDWLYKKGENAVYTPEWNYPAKQVNAR